MNPKIVQKELSYKIVNAAFAVHNQLGPGFLESIYEAAMVIELEIRGYQIDTQALSYLKATGMELAIVINFGTSSVKYERVVNTYKNEKYT